ncbi:aspartate racemase/maleate isomerase family protein [Falsiroseomonas oryzae]|uniref:aspartate racemase/maleate isomerase family protein n=1 Tax=Falsiroseomonas oryzae TaxID=2766473 RepID=UPI0022EB4FDE|nr:aspartate/glutamate racemase family protein [Roseomonas sp. MO-31]
MSAPPAIGTITPSSNRTVERTLAAILRHFQQLDSCVARIPYYGSGSGQPKDGYDAEAYRQAAWQLGHAGVGVVCWNGTRGAAVGLDADRALCTTMAEAAGCTAVTAALGTAALLHRLGSRRIAFVTPGTVAHAAEAAAGLGVACVGVRAMALSDNAAAAAVPMERIIALARDVASECRPDCILLWSTNLQGWPAMAPLEADLGIPVIDSAAAGIWACLDALGLDPRPAAAVGRIFTLGSGAQAG